MDCDEEAAVPKSADLVKSALATAATQAQELYLDCEEEDDGPKGQDTEGVWDPWSQLQEQGEWVQGYHRSQDAPGSRAAAGAQQPVEHSTRSQQAWGGTGPSADRALHLH